VPRKPVCVPGQIYLWGSITRPESLKYIASLLRDSRHARAEASGPSMEEGDRVTERMKNTVLYLEDVSVDLEKVHVVITIGGNACIRSQQIRHRLYK
jgi:hypothetical protein